MGQNEKYYMTKNTSFTLCIIIIYDKKNTKVETFEVGNIRSGQEILEKIFGINDKLDAANKSSISEV